MGTRRVAYFIDSIHHGIHRRIVADRVIRTVQVVVYRTGNPHDRHVMLLTQQAGAGERTISTNHHQRVQPILFHLLVSLCTSFHRAEFSTPGCLQDRSPALYDITHVMRFQSFHVSLDQPLVTVINPVCLTAIKNRRSHHRPNSGIHPRSIPPGGQNTYSFNLSHNHSIEN